MLKGGTEAYLSFAFGLLSLHPSPEFSRKRPNPPFSFFMPFLCLATVTLACREQHPPPKNPGGHCFSLLQALMALVTLLTPCKASIFSPLMEMQCYISVRSQPELGFLTGYSDLPLKQISVSSLCLHIYDCRKAHKPIGSTGSQRPIGLHESYKVCLNVIRGCCRMFLHF